MLLNCFFPGSHFEPLKRIYSPGDSIETCFDCFLGDSALRSAKKVFAFLRANLKASVTHISFACFRQVAASSLRRGGCVVSTAVEGHEEFPQDRLGD